jgi:hypothetical protein
MQEHPSPEVQAALVRLCDALCSWERATGRTSALILRERGGYAFRAASGKPNELDSASGFNNDVSDQEFIEMEAPKE